MYKKTQTLTDLILWMQDSADGVSIKDIMGKFNVSQRTAVRMKDSIAEKYPQIQEISGRYNTKRWRLPQGTGKEIITFSTEEIHALQNASKLLATKNIIDARYIDTVLHKIKAIIGKEAVNRIEPDAEALLEAEYHEHRKKLSAEEASETQNIASENIIKSATEQALEILRKLGEDKISFRKIGLTFEEKAFYDILIALRNQYNFEYGKDKEENGIVVNDKCKALAKKIKEIIDTKSSFTDWLNNQRVRNQLKLDIKIS